MCRTALNLPHWWRWKFSVTLGRGEKCNPSVHTHTLLNLFVLSESSTTLFYVRNVCWAKRYKKNQQVHIAFVKNSVAVCDRNEIIALLSSAILLLLSTNYVENTQNWAKPLIQILHIQSLSLFLFLFSSTNTTIKLNLLFYPFLLIKIWRD